MLSRARFPQLSVQFSVSQKFQRLHEKPIVTKWFAQECETGKGNLQSLGEKISKDPYNSELRQLLRDKKKRFKQTCRWKKREYISKGMSNIDMQNTKETWRQIGKMFNLGKRKTHGAETVSTEQFYKYFKQENATSPNNILDMIQRRIWKPTVTKERKATLIIQ